MESRKLQPVLGTDKKNPILTVFEDKKSNTIVVFFGMALLEVVPNNKEHALYKITVGKLYNAGVKRKSLVEAFGVARTTMQRWGAAVKLGTEKEMLESLKRPGFQKKITEDIERYIRWRFPKIYTKNHYSYSKELQEGIKKIFDKRLSSEALRPLLNTIKDELKKEDKCESRARACESKDSVLKNTGTKSRDVIDTNSSVKAYKSNAALKRNNRKNALPFYVSGDSYELCHHAGVLVYSHIVNNLKVVCEKTMLIKQWIISILLGAVNIEQTKLLDFNSIEVVLGKVIRHLDTQRVKLVKMSEEEQLRDMVLKYNGQLIKVDQYSDFYFDPHVKHYTGAKKILKGWCPGIRFADKVMNMDFIHTSQGHPVYVEDTDNFNDARVRFKQLLQNFRQKAGINSSKVITFTVDRGLYGIELFNYFMREGSCDHFIIWEKGYKRDGWDDKKASGKFEIFKCRNNANDLLKYVFTYIHGDWKKDKNIRQIIVRATNPQGNTIEVSILSDDKARNVEETIELMFKRWVQENDFKYLDKHFGINEITTYMARPYAAPLANSLTDVLQNSGKYKALQCNLIDDKDILKKYLLQKHMGKKSKKVNIDKEIEYYTNEIKSTTEELKKTQKEVSRLNTVIDECYYRMTTSTKALMDAIKITSRNMFYEAFMPFKKIYNNYRDDHVIFRNLTRSLGGISFGEKVVDVVLYPTMNYPKKTRLIIEQLLQNINDAAPTMPDGSNRTLKFSLGQKADKLFTIMPEYKTRPYAN